MVPRSVRQRRPERRRRPAGHQQLNEDVLQDGIHGRFSPAQGPRVDLGVCSTLNQIEQERRLRGPSAAESILGGYSAHRAAVGGSPIPEFTAPGADDQPARPSLAFRQRQRDCLCKRLQLHGCMGFRCASIPQYAPQRREGSTGFWIKVDSPPVPCRPPVRIWRSSHAEHRCHRWRTCGAAPRRVAWCFPPANLPTRGRRSLRPYAGF